MSEPPALNRIIQFSDPETSIELRAIWPAEVSALHVRGPFPIARPAIAIIGTTDPDPIARAWSFACAQHAVRQGWVVVSGLARGVDGAAHEGALAAGGTTVAVVASGLDSTFPAGRETLVDRIVGTGGTIVSISPPGTAVSRERLQLRNQFTSGLADIVLAVQARGRGGALATMRHASRHHRVIATFQPPTAGNPENWAGNTLLLGDDSPWPDRQISWKPAFALTEPVDLRQLFTHFERRSQVDASAAFLETRKPEQPRLLEERATYDGDE